ncbi:unnamed protein product, partial [Didymodactylos carnosus]
MWTRTESLAEWKHQKLDYWIAEHFVALLPPKKGPTESMISFSKK